MLIFVFQPYLLQDSLLLTAKYHYVVGDYESCNSYVSQIDMSNIDSLPKRSKCILSDALACKGIYFLQA